MIKVENLHKTFKTTSDEKGLFGKKKINFHAVKDLNLEVQEGQVLSLLGPNGCGKTTTLRMIAGMLEPAKGTAYIDGMDVRIHKQKIKSLIGYMTNNTSLYDRLTVLETVKFFAELNQIEASDYQERASNLFKQLDMEKYLDKKISDPSTGMKQKTSIVRTLIHDPKIVILDEPTTGVDVTGQSIIMDLIRHIKNQNKTIIFSTHQLGEVKDIADKIIVMDSGKKIFDGDKDEFQRVNPKQTFNEIFMDMVNE